MNRTTVPFTPEAWIATVKLAWGVWALRRRPFPLTKDQFIDMVELEMIMSNR
jgi:hypothetical protein